MKINFLILIASAIMLCSNCKKEGSSGVCETVVNPDGPGFLQVVNKCGSTVEVYMGNFIPFGADIRDGACEIYGLPVKTREVEFTRQSDGKLVVKTIAIEEGKTVVETLTSSFFN